MSVIIRIVIALAILCAYSGAWYYVGKSRATASYREEQQAQANDLAQKEKDQAQQSDRIVTQYVDRIKRVEVPVYVEKPDDSCLVLGRAFRVFHDSSVRGIVPDAASATDAPPVAVKDVADTIGDNYSACQKNAEQLIALQQWASEVSK